TQVLGGSGGMVSIPVEHAPEEIYRKRGIGFMAWIAIGWLVFIGLVAALAPILPIKDPINGTDYANPNAGLFSGSHLLGTDASGLDVLSRVIWGARASLLIGIGSIVFGTIIGG